MFFFIQNTLIELVAQTSAPDFRFAHFSDFEKKYKQWQQEAFVPTEARQIKVAVENLPLFLEQMQNYFHYISAAGGIVRKKEAILFIKRRGFWDLPKGHIEMYEDSKSAALREVEEETGIKALITQPEPILTYHTYTQAGKPIMKKTYWYQMVCLDESQSRPQVEEDISEVAWIEPRDIEITLAQTFASIRWVLEHQKKSS
jgi:ADP-ribose pyrophosphatase YjhB (NUDIX family)